MPAMFYVSCLRHQSDNAQAYNCSSNRFIRIKRECHTLLLSCHDNHCATAEDGQCQWNQYTSYWRSRRFLEGDDNLITTVNKIIMHSGIV